MDAAFDAIQIKEISLEDQNKVVKVLDTIEQKISINNSIKNLVWSRGSPPLIVTPPFGII